jgi:hypothetical protein
MKVRHQRRDQLPADNENSAVGVSSDLALLLGPPALIDGEDAAQYEAFYQQVRSAVGPKDAIEEIWAREVADLSWEVLRYRRLKAAFMRSSAYEGLRRLSSLTSDEFPGNDLALDLGEPGEQVKAVKQRVAKAGFDEAVIMAQAMAANLDSIEKFEEVIANIDVRRNRILREVLAYREEYARRP